VCHRAVVSPARTVISSSPPAQAQPAFGGAFSYGKPLSPREQTADEIIRLLEKYSMDSDGFWRRRNVIGHECTPDNLLC
jgi:hypothetical protein